MKLTRAGSTPSAPGPADWFTGQVRFDGRFQTEAPARLGGASVTFEPGARTNWHTHPLGQLIIVTGGLGRAQREGGPLEVIGPGDMVWFEPGERHWHGAAPHCAMTHLAIAEAENGVSVVWAEPVAAADYDPEG